MKVNDARETDLHCIYLYCNAKCETFDCESKTSDKILHFSHDCLFLFIPCTSMCIFASLGKLVSRNLLRNSIFPRSTHMSIYPTFACFRTATDHDISSILFYNICFITLEWQILLPIKKNKQKTALS